MRSVIVIGIALTVVTLAVYWQVGNHEFINFDDDMFITNNVHVLTGITKDNLVWAFSPVPDIGWFPVTWLSHMVDVEMYGLKPRGHHLTNVAFHTAATLLLFLLLFRTTHAPWQSAFVAALFALHPLHVESVAWMAERRDVLSACFGFLALWLYAEYVMQYRRSFYLLALLAFVLGLMAKPMLVTLPVIMLLLDIWPLNRYGGDEKLREQRQWLISMSALTSLAKEKFLFFVCSLISAIITLNVPPAVESLQYSTVVPLGKRIANATTAYVKYLAKMFWPTDLAVFYPFPASFPPWQVIGSLLILLAISAAVIRAKQQHPYLLVGWFWYLMTLVPVLGLIEFGRHATADRYTYIPLVGLFIAVAWGIPALTQTLPYRRSVLTLAMSIVITVVTVLTWQQLSHWQDSISLFQHTIRVTSGNYLAQSNLGTALAEKGHLDEAIELFNKAIEINPNYSRSYYNLGIALAAKGNLDQAIKEYRKAIEIYPDYFIAHNNLGLALAEKGHLDEAIAEFTRALEINPNDFKANHNLRLAMEQRRMTNEVR